VATGIGDTREVVLDGPCGKDLSHLMIGSQQIAMDEAARMPRLQDLLRKRLT
jgi:hypothetical protein